MSNEKLPGNRKKILSFTLLTLTVLTTVSLIQVSSNLNVVFGQNDLKTTVQQISTHIDESLKSYAAAVGEKYFEGEHSPLNVNTTVIKDVENSGEGKLVNTGQYNNAQKHLKEAQFMFLNLIPQIKNTNSDDVIQVQSGMLMLQNIFNYRGAYNLAEDVGFGVVQSHLENIVK